MKLFKLVGSGGIKMLGPIHGKSYCSVCRKEIEEGTPLSFDTTKTGYLRIAHLVCIDAKIPPVIIEEPKKWWEWWKS